MTIRTRQPAIAAIALLALIVVACNAKGTVQKAVNLVPMAISTVNAFEAALGPDSPTRAVLEKVKTGLAAFQKAGTDYLAAPNATGFAAVLSAADVFVADFDSILPNLPAQYKAVATAADVALHLIQMVVSSASQPTPAPTMRARLSNVPAHVDQAALKALAHREGLDKYVK